MSDTTNTTTTTDPADLDVLRQLRPNDLASDERDSLRRAGYRWVTTRVYVRDGARTTACDRCRPPHAAEFIGSKSRSWHRCAAE